MKFEVHLEASTLQGHAAAPRAWLRGRPSTHCVLMHLAMALPRHLGRQYAVIPIT